MALTQDQLEHLYESALTAGAILSGFIGTFLTFRIQREAGYYRQPVLDFSTQEGRDARVDLSRFPVSLLLILPAAVLSILCGMFLPLAGLAHWKRCMASPGFVLGGIVASLVLVAVYFVAEMFHYRMFRISRAEWRREGWIAAVGISIAAVLGVITYFSVGS
jgi:hypothetical protein